MEQAIIDRAVAIATQRAMNEHPVASITWIPPISASSDPMGLFVIKECPSLTASETAPWDR